jgi:hypothetical protein
VTETVQMLFNKYGATMTIDQLAQDVFKIEPVTLKNKIYRGACPIPTHKEGGPRVADVRDVAEYLDKRRADAKKEFDAEQERLNQ